MAFFGVYTAAQAVSATDAADTIKYFGGSAISTAATVIAGSGNDIIWLVGVWLLHRHTRATPTGTGGVLSRLVKTSTALRPHWPALVLQPSPSLVLSPHRWVLARFVTQAFTATRVMTFFTAGATAAWLKPPNSTIGGGAGDDVIGTIATSTTQRTPLHTTALSSSLH